MKKAIIETEKGTIELDLSTAPVTEAAIGTYDTTLKLTIRRTS